MTPDDDRVISDTYSGDEFVGNPCTDPTPPARAPACSICPDRDHRHRRRLRARPLDVLPELRSGVPDLTLGFTL